VTFGGYEIHVGVTAGDENLSDAAFAILEDGVADGYDRGGVLGTYLHGAFENPEVCTEVFGVPMPAAMAKATHYQQLASWFERHGRRLDLLGFD
jgi:adenosylcobyric acid synthase